MSTYRKKPNKEETNESQDTDSDNESKLSVDKSPHGFSTIITF